jgi:hypothetical protein
VGGRDDTCQQTNGHEKGNDAFCDYANTPNKPIMPEKKTTCFKNHFTFLFRITRTEYFYKINTPSTSENTHVYICFKFNTVKPYAVPPYYTNKLRRTRKQSSYLQLSCLLCRYKGNGALCLVPQTTMPCMTYSTSPTWRGVDFWHSRTAWPPENTPPIQFCRRPILVIISNLQPCSLTQLTSVYHQHELVQPSYTFRTAA